jgi:hypothetical protein
MASGAILTEQGMELVSDPAGARAGSLRETYQQLRFVQVDSMVRPDLFADVVARTLVLARPYATRREQPHRIASGALAGGFRFDRIDWGPHEGSRHSRRDREALQAAFDAGGLGPFATGLAHLLLPFLEAVTGRKLGYDRVFLLVYGEGDFIDPHGDAQTSPRLKVQIPVCFGCRSALRVLKDGFLEPFYDEPGCLRLVGAGIWHDVMPILRLEPERPPERVLVSMRFPYLDGPETLRP